MACSSNCPTPGAHQTFGECLRAKSLQIANPAAHKFLTSQDKELNDYVAARKAGLQPKSTQQRDVDFAWKETERTGEAFRADK